MRSAGQLVGACSAFLVVVVASGCSGGTTPVAAPPSPTATGAPAPQQTWLSVDIPGQITSEMRTAIYDQTRDVVWVMSREEGAYASDPEFVTLTRVNVADRSILKEPLKLSAEGYDVGLIAIDAHDVVWMAWGSKLVRFDPATGATKQWTRPPYSGLARVYSGDGRMDGMTISSDGEIWLTAGMLTAVFGFNPNHEQWDRPIGLTFVPGFETSLASPGPGIITVDGTALAGGGLDPQYSPRFAVITTSTRSVKTLAIPVRSYVAIGGGQIIYASLDGTLVRYDVLNATSTPMAATPQPWTTNANMSLDPQGNIWLPLTTQGFPGVARLNPSTGAISQFPFPIAIRYFEPRPPSPPPCFGHACLLVECKPAVVFRCVPTPVSLGPEIEGMAPDAHGNLWIVTPNPSSSNPEGYGPVVELVVRT